MDRDLARLLSLAALTLAVCSSDDDDSGSESAADTTSTSSGEENTAPTGDAPGICQSYVDHFVDCTGATDFQAAQASGNCNAQLGEAAPKGEACRSANEDFFVCLSGLDCASFGDIASACPEERDAIDVACNGAGGSTSG